MQDELIVCLCIVLLGLVLYVYQIQLGNLARKARAAERLLPMCRTVSDALSSVSKDFGCINNLLSSLEKSQFRSTTLTIFTSTGNVLADSTQPIQGQRPVPPSTSNAILFQSLKQHGILESEKTPIGVAYDRMGQSDKTVSTAAVRGTLNSIGIIVICMQTTMAQIDTYA